MTITKIAEDFSGHRFTETYAYLARDVRWESVGGPIIEGRDAVISACNSTLAELADTTTEFTRFRTVAGTDAVVVDVIARYSTDGSVAVVASCDIYQFNGGMVQTITSYTVELPG